MDLDDAMAAIDPFQDASVDPWSGKALGEVEKPEGFDEFWNEQEAGKDLKNH